MFDVLNEHYRTGYGTTRYRRKRFIPEPFMWFFFETLAKAGILMERGDLEKRGGGYWQLINHRDVKHANSKVILQRTAYSVINVFTQYSSASMTQIPSRAITCRSLETLGSAS